jgi:hypothetical protein
MITPETGTVTQGLGGFQEAAQLPMFQEFVKYQGHVNHPARIAEYTGRCFDRAHSEIGPTQLNIPRDYFYGDIDVEIPQPQRLDRGAGGERTLQEAADLLAQAKFPVIVSGGGVVMADGMAECQTLAERLGAAVVNSYQHNDSFPASHPLWCGPLGYQGSKAGMKLISKADVVVALGSRLGPFGTLPQHGMDYWPKDAKLAKRRALLDKRLRKQGVNADRLARYLKHLISSPDRAGWEFGLEEGYLDSARLASLITSPNDRRLFKKEQVQAASDCVVSILIDNSGSMNHHNDVVAAMIDTLARALELAQIKTEILGFTSTEWHGGRVLKEWAKAGKPESPGRLTSTCHNIYKAAETPWRRSRPAIAAMLKTDLFREGVDGEALEWAVARIEVRPEMKKIIIMVSDGSPMDTATHAANSDRYLDQHLSYVANAVQRRPDIQLCAFGVGLDLSAYYRESMEISLSDELGTQDFMGIADLLARAG